MVTIEMLRTMNEALDEIDLSFITRLVIYREMKTYLISDELEKAVERVYDAWQQNEIWCDLMVFSKNVAEQWSEYDDKAELLQQLIRYQDELE